MNIDTERSLLEYAQRDSEAFRALYRHYFSRVYAYVAYRVPQVWDAEDVVSEVFFKVADALDRFEYRGEGALTAWIFSIARNQVAQFYRIHQVQSVPLDAVSELRSDKPTPDQMVLNNEHSAHLHHMIETLSPRRREIILLRFFGGLRNQEIAQILDLDERTVASHLHRALQDLRNRQKENPYDAERS